MRAPINIAVALVLVLPSYGLAQSSKSHVDISRQENPVDCTKIKIEYVDNPSLTREENIALMDLALIRSLSKYDHCQNNQSQTTNTTGNLGGASAKGENTTGGSNSVAASDLSGTEQNSAKTESAGQSSKPVDPTAKKPHEVGLLGDEKTRAIGNQQGGGSGKLPEDIPPANNDSVLETQIRQAAIMEKDPAVQAKLWNEYRKYKGVPLVK